MLEYEFFSAACDLTLFAIEAALRVRFVQHYSRRIPVVARASKVPLARSATRGARATLLADSFEEVWRMARYWELGPSPSGETMRLPSALEGLLTWARREGMLPGRRTRFVDWHSQEKKVALQFGRRGSQ